MRIAFLLLVFLLSACSAPVLDMTFLEENDVDEAVIHFIDFRVNSFGLRTESGLAKHADLHLTIKGAAQVEAFSALLPSTCRRETRPVASPDNLHAVIYFRSAGRVVSTWRFSRFDFAYGPGPLNCRMDDAERDQVRQAVEFARTASIRTAM